MIDRKTRGRTSPARLRALDAYLLLAHPALLTGPPENAAFVDVGFGEHPWTTLESAAALRALAPGLCIIGVEREPARVAAAQHHADPHTRFVQGGFDALADLGPARIVRAMNVLRTYPQAQARDAHALLGAPLMEGGLLLEGSADPTGAILTCHLVRRRGATLVREALLFFTDFTHGFAPLLFRDWLPRDLRRRVHPGEWIHAFFDQWTRSWLETRGDDPRESFIASTRRLSEQLPGADGSYGAQGYLLFRPAGGVPP